MADDIFANLGMQLRGYDSRQRLTMGRCRMALARYRVHRAEADLEIVYDSLVALGVLVPEVTDGGLKAYTPAPEFEDRFREFFS